MTKRDLVVKIAKEVDLIQSDVAKVVQKTLDYIADELVNGNTIELRNFGVFEIKVRKSRKGRNPNQPQNEVIIPERAVVKFRAGKELKEEVEKLLATRDYKVLFLLDRTQGQIMEYPASGHIQYSIFGHLHVQGDTLKYHFEDILIEQNEILPIRNYRQAQLESGDIEVSFSVTMKKRKKEEEVPFRITIQAPNKLWINVGKEAYRGSFTSIPWNYNIETQ